MTRSNFGTIQKHGDGFRVFWQEDGRKRSKVIDGTLDDAERFLAKAKLRKVGEISNSITYTRYWEDVVEPTFCSLSERTAYDYRRLWSAYLAPQIGYKQVSATTWRFVETVLGFIKSPTAQHQCYRLWKKVCNMAVRDGLLQSNPIDRTIRLKQVKKREKYIYEREEIAVVLSQAEKYKHLYLIACEIGGGLRHEEACALTKSDISFDEDFAILSVSKALTVAGGSVIHKDTKTAFSERLVAVGEPFRSVIRANYAKVPDSVNLQSSPVTITRNWKGYCERNGIKHVPFGNMRTNFSVLHQQAGSIDSIVSMNMGHSDGTTRGNNYLKQNLLASKMIAENLQAFLME